MMLLTGFLRCPSCKAKQKKAYGWSYQNCAYCGVCMVDSR